MYQSGNSLRAGALGLCLAAAACAGQAAGDQVGMPAAANTPRQTKPVTLDQLAARARSEGLRGRVHGAVPRAGAYIFTWTKPGNFFESFNISLVAGDPETAKSLAALERHQEALVRGELKQEYGSQPHLIVESIEPGEKWSPGVAASPPSEPPADLQRELAGRAELTAMVHALAEDGGMLVVEWRDAVIPVQVPADDRLRREVGELYRGDRVRIRFRIAPHPPAPLHLQLDPEGAGEEGPLEVLDSIHRLHGRQHRVEGRLVLFPKSPVLQRSIWAVEEEGEDGLHRYFTIFNFDDLKDQDRTDARLQAAWSARPEGVLDGRNKYIHTGVRVRVTGKVNNPAQNQANPALALRSDQVEILAGPGAAPSGL